jgi:hypothetical protein
VFWRRWLRKRKFEREARRLLTLAFRDKSPLRGTSLRARHAGRWVLAGYETDPASERIVRIRFGILRHPRPYSFSTQSHKVIESYLYEVDEGRIRVERGHNITRERGGDAD